MRRVDRLTRQPAWALGGIAAIRSGPVFRKVNRGGNVQT
jgi:hypothetical protein